MAVRNIAVAVGNAAVSCAAYPGTSAQHAVPAGFGPGRVYSQIGTVSIKPVLAPFHHVPGHIVQAQFIGFL